MILQTIYLRKNLCLLVVIFIVSFFTGENAVFGQNIQSRSDTVRLGGEYFIQRNFEYSVSRNDTVLNGKYALSLMPDLSEGFYGRDYVFGEAEAYYENNRKQGAFSLRNVSLQPELSNMYPATGHLQIPYSGTIAESRGRFEKNRPAGQWDFMLMEQSPGADVDTVFQVQAFFGREGILQDQYKIFDRKSEGILTGRFGEDGTLDDALELHAENGSLLARMVFDDGLLTAINRPGERSLRPDYQAKVARAISFEERPLDSLYVKIISYYIDLPAAEREQVLRPIEAIHTSFAFLEGTHSPLMEHLPGEHQFQQPRVKVPVYEITEEEREIVVNKHHRLNMLNSQVDSILQVSAFSVNRYADRELASLYARIQVVKRRIERQQRFSQILAGPLLQHIGPAWFLQRRLSEVELLDTANYTFREQQFQDIMEFSYATGDDLTPFEQYRSYITSLEESFIMLRNEVNQYLERVVMDTRLSEQEERLSMLSAEIDQLVDSIALNMYTQEVSRAYKQSFLEFKEQRLESYATMEAEQRMLALEGIVNCLEQMKLRLENAQMLAEKEILVDQAYTNTVLNPFTYTEMQERLFERLFRAYQNKLVPYLVGQMMPVQNCDEFLERADNLERLQDFMLRALNDNPRRTERQIRNIDEPGAIIRKLGIPVVL